MDWQQLMALIVVGATAALLVRSRVRRRKFQFGRDTHCGCSHPSGSAPQSSIVFHARKGGPSSVTVKMK